MRGKGVVPCALALFLLVTGPAQAGRRYLVRWGDTLTGIASTNGTSVRALARLNVLQPSALLLAGTVIRVPAPTAASMPHLRYLVRPGDTLSAIAARHATTVSALAEANGLDPRGILFAGTFVRVPLDPRSEAAAAPVRATIDYWARRYGIDPALARGLAWMESGYQTDVTSVAGAHGVMQVTPAAWNFVEDVVVGGQIERTMEGNVRVGIAYLHHLLHRFGGSERLALAAYYQGERGVRRRGVLPETRAYVADVLALRSRV